MHLLYLDDSGSVGNAEDTHIILAGVAVFERQPHWFSVSLDRVAERLWPDNPKGLEFRGADIYGGKKQWRGIGRDARLEAYRDALRILAQSNHVRLFGAAIHKASVSPEDPMELAFEHVSSRFDRFLGRLHKAGDTQRGLIVLDESSYETSLQSLAHEFRTEGHRWGQLYNLSDVPLFVNSKATRMIQYADMVAYALRRYYTKGDASLFDIIASRLRQVASFTVSSTTWHPNMHAIASLAAPVDCPDARIWVRLRTNNRLKARPARQSIRTVRLVPVS